MQTAFELLKRNAYPGRGILIGRSDDGAKSVIAYFITGRSVNSRNRVFAETTDGIRTTAYDPAKLVDPSLIIYHPVRRFGDAWIVTNGNQTDTVRDALMLGGTFESALDTREFEPDAPNYTPRISGILWPATDGAAHKLSILKRDDASGACQRFTYRYSHLAPGQAHMIHTYMGDGNPLPSFAGEPTACAIAGELDAFARDLFDSLDKNNRVALYVAYISDDRIQTRVLNALGGN